MKPIIGLTSARIDSRFAVHEKYIEAIDRAGGVAIIIPSNDRESETYINMIDGILFTGGFDVQPSMYNAKANPKLETTDSIRDSSEYKLFHAAMSKQMPILGICRGMQIINVLLGGTLHQHVPDVYGDKIPHRYIKAGDSSAELTSSSFITHSVQVVKGSILNSISGDKLDCVSSHHQSLDRLGKGVKVVATSDDGVVEAIEIENYKKLVAVQWHPEQSALVDTKQQALFDNFILNCKQ